MISKVKEHLWSLYLWKITPMLRDPTSVWHILYILFSIFSHNSTGPDLSHFWYLKIKVFSQNIHRSRPVAHFIYSCIFSRNSTGPDLSHFGYLEIKVFPQNIHRSGPVVHFMYSSIFSHNSTGPDLSHFYI